MAKAKKGPPSDDQNSKPATEVSGDVVEAEVVEELTAKDLAADPAGDSASDPKADAAKADRDQADPKGEESASTASQEPADPQETAETAPETDTASASDSTAEADAVADETTPDQALEAPDAVDAAEPEAADSSTTQSPAEPGTVSSSQTTGQTAAASGGSAQGFVPLVFGGILAGAIGFGVAYYLYGVKTGETDALLILQDHVATQSQQIQTLDARTQTAVTADQSLSADLETLTGSIDGLTGSLSAVHQQFDDISAALTLLDGRITDLEKRPITQGLPSSAIQAYERELEDLKASVTAQRAEAAAMEENAKLTAQQALSRAAMSRVLSALEAGQPFRAPLNDLVSATGTAAPVLLDNLADTGAPSLASLQGAFPDAARAALAAARKTEDAGGNRLMSFMKAQLGARSVTPQQGDGADAVLSRAEASLLAGNLTDTLAELAALPDTARAALAAWETRAVSRRDALAAGNALSQALNSN